MKRGLSKSFLIITIIIIIVVLHYASLLKWIETPILNMLAPIQNGLYKAGSSSYSFFYNYTHCNNLASENDLLHSQLVGNDIDQVKFDELFRENEYLRNELDFIDHQAYEIVLTQIISKPLLQNDLFIINRGSSDGIEIGQPVIAEQGILVGKVFAVEEHRSSIALLTNSESTIAVSLNNNSFTQGVVQGSMGLGLLMDLIPMEEVINIDDLVYSSGLEDMIGENYLIGKVVNILSGDTELYQRAEIVPSVDYKQLRILSVIISK
jgi:rod shape-determining protein MreC